MGVYAEDLLHDFATEGDKVFKKTKGMYRINIVHRITMEVFWTEKIKASSPKDCQTVFRRDFPQIRKQFTHEYALQVIEL